MSSLVFGNGTDVVRWKPSSNTRGTVDILTTCIITLLLCVWTAVHLNVSPPETFWRPKIRKFGWLIIALLAPEIVAYSAWYQRQQALSIMREVNKIYGFPNPPQWHEKMLKLFRRGLMRLRSVLMLPGQQPARQPTLESQRMHPRNDRHPWTIVHGFYAIMGGFAIQVPANLPKSKKFLPLDTDKIWFVSEEGLRVLLHEESAGRTVLPDLSEEEVRSKSKATGLAKALVCFQAVWFIAQCLTRLAQRIPIALLELNTFGHAVCALLIYLIWWEKPFEVDFPTIIHSQLLMDVRAFKWMTRHSSTMVEVALREWQAHFQNHPTYSALPKRHQRYISNVLAKQTSHLEDESSFIKGFDAHYADSETVPTCESGTDQQAIMPNGGDGTYKTTLATGQTLSGTKFELRSLNESLKTWNIISNKYYKYYFQGSIALHEILRSEPPPLRLVFTDEDALRWRMAWQAILMFKTVHKPEKEARRSRVRSPTSLLTERCGDWPDMDSVKIPTVIGFSITTLIYGGLHALAWHANFQSSTEQLLWRLSACAVMSGLPVSFLFVKILNRVEDRQPRGLMLETLRILISHALALRLVEDMVLYGAARAYLVVECFINLTHLPAGVYDVPNWSAYFPHIS